MMTLWIPGIALVVLLYMVHWTLLFDSAERFEDIEVRYRFGHWFPRLLLWISVRDPERRSRINRAVTLPHPFRRRIVVLVAKRGIKGPHRAHEIAGHGWQIRHMGPIDYLCTYVWHYILRRGDWANHMMERDAENRGKDAEYKYGDIGVLT